MEALQIQIQIQTVTSPRNHQPQFMSFFSSRLRPNPKSCFIYPHLRAFFSAASAPSTNPISTIRSRAVRVSVGVSDAQLKENWLASLSCPFPQGTSTSTASYVGHGGESDGSSSASSWVIGVDPDISGALALLKGDDSADSAQVFDSPQLQVLVGKRVRKRLDAKSIVQLLCSFGAPIGTTAYIEQSIPYPKDGKQGWWSGGFGYGMWIGILVASGFSVVPVPSLVWKKKFELSGNGSSKDDSRRVASSLFPLLSSSLKRKKDHGRAEALLIAAYGKDMKMNLDSSLTLEKIES